MTKPKPKKPPRPPREEVVYVEWDDACHQEGPEYPEDMHGVVKMRSAGILIKSTEEVVVFASNKQDDGRYREIMTIPMKYVTTLRTLSVR